MYDVIRVTICGTAAAVLTFGWAGVAIAEDELQPATNPNSCAQVDGVFWSNELHGTERVQTCTVEGSGDTIENVPASHPKQAWTVDVLTPGGGVVYRFQPAATPNHTQESLGNTSDPYVVGCYNQRGNVVDDFETNPHCQPAD